MKIILKLIWNKIKKFFIKFGYRCAIVFYKMLIVFFKERRKYLLEMIHYFNVRIAVLEGKQEQIKKKFEIKGE